MLDTGPLTHFARSQWLGVLKAVLHDVDVVIPDLVERELTSSVASNPHNRAVLDADWIAVVPLDTDARLAALARFTARLVGPQGRNIGECGVLALAETTPDAIAVVDDGAAVRAARDHGVPVRRTLGLLCEAVRAQLLTVPLVSALADDLLASRYRLPFRPGGFARWAEEQGMT